MKRNKLVVGLTYDLASDYALRADDPKDKYSEFDTAHIVHGVQRALEKEGYTLILIGGFSALLSRGEELKKTVDIVFNTAEGLAGRNREAQVPLLLEYLGIPYVGSDALTMSLTLDKVMTKKILIADNIPTPAFVTTAAPLESLASSSLSFPLIVKPQWEGSSKGMTAKSKVKNLSELNTQITHIAKNYHQPALIESFVEGRECTVALIGNGKNFVVFPPLEIRIRGRQAGDKIFVNRYVYTNDVHYECPAKLSPSVLKRMQEAARRTYDAVGCKDFGRVDFRVDQNGTPYVLEINPIPALSKQDTFGSIAKSQSISYDAMIVNVLRAALARYGL